MKSEDKTLNSFCIELASALPAPGGGGAAALAGSLSACLVSMAANLTLGKRKYADVEPDMKSAIDSCAGLSEKLLSLIDKDEECFLPLAAAYSLPKDTPNYEAIRRDAILTAASAPLEMLRTVSEILPSLEVLYEKGSRLMLSDVGCAAALCVGAARCAAMNVFVNTKLLPDDPSAQAVAAETSGLLQQCSERAGSISDAVLLKLSGD